MELFEFGGDTMEVFGVAITHGCGGTAGTRGMSLAEERRSPDIDGVVGEESGAIGRGWKCNEDEFCRCCANCPLRYFSVNVSCCCVVAIGLGDSTCGVRRKLGADALYSLLDKAGEDKAGEDRAGEGKAGEGKGVAADDDSPELAVGEGVPAVCDIKLCNSSRHFKIETKNKKKKV